MLALHRTAVTPAGIGCCASEEFGVAVRKRYATNLVAQRISHHTSADLALDSKRRYFLVSASGSHHAVLEVDFVKPVTFDHAVMMEWLNDGQHVQQFRLEEWDGRAWKTLMEGHV